MIFALYRRRPDRVIVGGTGEKRGRFYVAGEWLKQQKAETSLPQVASDPFTGEQVREEPAPYEAPAVTAELS
jgi:hypothetical protein